MKNWQIIIILILGIQILSSCSNSLKKEVVVSESNIGYDMRKGLNPSRLTIAMWDFSWLYMHHPGGAFEDFNKVLDELKERNFNTVRIDAFPLIIGMLHQENELITIKGDSLRNWGPTPMDYKHNIVAELIEFMTLTREKGLNVILSTWNTDCLEYPDTKNYIGNDKQKYWMAWEKTLNILKHQQILDHVVYVDLDQEYPYFSPTNSELNRLGEISGTELNAMEQAGQLKIFEWNRAQYDYVKDYISSSLKHFQQNFPELRFTFSLTSYWEEIRSMGIRSFDVLELHFWMTQMERFNNRSGFDKITKDRGERKFLEYAENLDATLHSVKPMLLKEMHNRLQFAKDWSEETAAPLTTTEAWGPWWHMDHEDLDWKWLYDWCEQCMAISSEYDLWGATPWNYSHPYWKNWEKVEWYKNVNTGFLNN